MRYRKMDADDDYVFGNSQFLVNTPEGVAQAIRTRMRLLVREWFLDLSEGLDMDHIWGYGTQATRDTEVQDRILGTTGVIRISNYASDVDGTTRAFVVSCTVDTLYGTININEAIR